MAVLSARGIAARCWAARGGARCCAGGRRASRVARASLRLPFLQACARRRFRPCKSVRMGTASDTPVAFVNACIRVFFYWKKKHMVLEDSGSESPENVLAGLVQQLDLLLQYFWVGMVVIH